jgi:hypothetical protein
MISCLSGQRRIILCYMLILSLSACSLMQEATIPTSSPSPVSTTEPTPMPTQESTAASATPSTEQPVVVALVKDGNIQLWDEATNQIQIIVNAGDVTDVTMSDDGQVIAFTRLVGQPGGIYGYRNSALWAVDRNGENPRELVSAETLHQRLSSNAEDYTTIAEMDWIPGTHRLIYSGMIISPVGLFSGAEDVYLVDADTLSDMLLAPAGNGVRIADAHDGRQFVPSPDGTQVALISGAELSFVNADGSNLRQAVLTYPQTGLGDVLFVPTGVWTQDSRFFLINALVEVDQLYTVNFTISRVPADGSPAEPLATITNSSPSSAIFSPDGQRAAFRRLANQEPMLWLITPLAVNTGPLALSFDVDLGAHANLHWSPAGDAYVFHGSSLWRLCPNATEDSQVCGDPIQLEEGVAAIHWMDSNRFLFVTRDLNTSVADTLFLSGLDGTKIPIVTWSPGGYLHHYAAVIVQH